MCSGSCAEVFSETDPFVAVQSHNVTETFMKPSHLNGYISNSSISFGFDTIKLMNGFARILTNGFENAPSGHNLEQHTTARSMMWCLSQSDNYIPVCSSHLEA